MSAHLDMRVAPNQSGLNISEEKRHRYLNPRPALVVFEPRSRTLGEPMGEPAGSGWSGTERTLGALGALGAPSEAVIGYHRPGQGMGGGQGGAGRAQGPDWCDLQGVPQGRDALRTWPPCPADPAPPRPGHALATPGLS